MVLLTRDDMTLPSPVNLEQFIVKHRKRFGIPRKQIYAKNIQLIINKYSDSIHRFPSSTNTDIRYKMLYRRKIDATLGNPYLISIADGYKTTPLDEQTSGESGFIACNNSPSGEKIIHIIDGIMRQLSYRKLLADLLKHRHEMVSSGPVIAWQDTSLKHEFDRIFDIQRSPDK
jgi:hypothetical protein